MRSLIVGLAGLAITLAGASAVLAQAAAPPPAAAPSAAAPAPTAAPPPAAAMPAPTAAPAASTVPAAAGAPSVATTTIGDLIANPKSKAVLSADYAPLLAYPGLSDIEGMTLVDISAYPQAKLDSALLTKIQTDLNTAFAH